MSKYFKTFRDCFVAKFAPRNDDYRVFQQPANMKALGQGRFAGTGTPALTVLADRGSNVGACAATQDAGPPMPPLPALALAEPEARFLSSRSTRSIEAGASDTAGSPPWPIAWV